MRVIFSLCFIAAVASAVQQENFKIPPESLSKLHSIALPCAEKFNLDASIIRRVGDKDLPRDDMTNKFLHCFAENIGFVDKNGHMVPERIAAVLGNHPRKQELIDVLTKCNEVSKEDPVATTVAMHECYLANSPVLYQF